MPWAFPASGSAATASCSGCTRVAVRFRGRLETAPDDPDGVTNPKVLVEVVSPSTEAHDRGAKWAHYRRIASLREYILVAQDEPRIELYRRNEAGRWELHEAQRGDRITVESLGLELEVDAVYENPLST